MLRRLAVSVLMVSAGLAVAADGPVPNLAPPDTNAIIGLNMRAVVDSGLVQSMGADIFKSAGAQWTSSSPFPGVNPLKDVDEILVASTAEGDHPPSLVICRGRFPVEEIGKGAERYHGIPIQVKDGNAMALLDAGTLLAGDLKVVRAAIDRRGSHAPGLDSALARRAGELSARYAVWGVGKLPHGFHPSSGKVEGLGSLDRFDFGIALSQGLELTATLHVGAPEDAQKLAAAMQFVQMMAKAQPDANGTKIESHVENGTVSLSVAITAEALKKAVEQQRAAFQRGFSKAIAKPPAADEVKIFGSDGSKTVPGNGVATVTGDGVKIVSDKDGNTLQVTLPGKP